jgi:hypothetical protein
VDFSTSLPYRASVQNISKILEQFEPGVSPVEQSDRVFRCRGTQVHLALRRRQVRVAGQLLNGARRRAFHCQMRAERVPQDVFGKELFREIVQCRRYRRPQSIFQWG